ncbi:MAG: serine acetyltransferase [Muribaculaceae bacterium]|nr:serine acetyltransferase [Bacteroides sp.]MDE6072506.1 serine acetyltransferase [Muribaculaceae bacterium]
MEQDHLYTTHSDAASRVGAVIQHTVEELSRPTDIEQNMMPVSRGPLPSVEVVREIVDIVKTIVFPEFLDRLRGTRTMHEARLSVSIEKLFRLLSKEISHCVYEQNLGESTEQAAEEGMDKALSLIERLSEIKRLLYTDVQAIFDNDPAAENFGEVILSYPVVQAMVHYRLAHQLMLLKVPVLPRIITELAHSETGIDINPGATIGEYFAIDHGTGVVIGETCIIGNHVTLYQGVTLGAKNFTLDGEGHPVNVPRHPILEDHVTVYANATILGRITVGHDSIVGGNIWLTESVPPYSKIVQRCADCKGYESSK